MQKKGFLDKFKILSRPTGRPHWGQAVRAIILMLLAASIAKFLGLDKGIGAIVFITLLATLIIDVPLPIRKIFVLTLLSLLMTILAFISASLSIQPRSIYFLHGDLDIFQPFHVHFWGYYGFFRLHILYHLFFSYING